MKAMLLGLGRTLPSRLPLKGDFGRELGRTLGVALFVLAGMLVISAAIELARAIG